MVKTVALLAAVGACIWSSLLILHATSDSWYAEDSYMNPQENKEEKQIDRSDCSESEEE